MLILTFRKCKIGGQVDQMKKTMADLQTAIQAAQEKQKEAKAEIKKLEKDMADFKNNKEGKIDELKVGPSALIAYADTNITMFHRKKLRSRRVNFRNTTCVSRRNKRRSRPLPSSLVSLPRKCVLDIELFD